MVNSTTEQSRLTEYISFLFSCQLSEDWQIDYESYDWRKLDPDSEECKTMVKEYFAWEGDFKHVGKAFNQGKVFKWEDTRAVASVLQQLNLRTFSHMCLLNCNDLEWQCLKKSELPPLPPTGFCFGLWNKAFPSMPPLGADVCGELLVCTHVVP